MQNIIKRAIQICWEHRCVATPNPTVFACVIDDNGLVIADGLTQPYPGKHAERIALENAGEKAKGATLFVTLEPCSHHGKNPPCTDAIIKSGIKHVIYALDDLFLKGGGVKALNDAGISVEKIENTVPFEHIYQGFLRRIENNQPHIIHKIALNKDGTFSHPQDKEKQRPVWITSKESRKDVHLWRSRSCAILSSLKSIKDDQSQLNVRMGVNARRNPNIIAFSSSPENYIDDIQRLKSAHENRTIETLRENDLKNFSATREKLSNLNVNNLYVEVGSELSHKLIQANFADEYHIYTPSKNYNDMPIYQTLLSISSNVVKTAIGTDTKIILKVKA